MIYLKTYESNKNKYKKYLVLYGDSVLDKQKIIWVFENIDEYLSDNLIIIKMLFKYKNEIIFMNKEKISAGIDELENELIYQSDNLDNVKKMLPSLYDSKKFNL